MSLSAFAKEYAVSFLSLPDQCRGYSRVASRALVRIRKRSREGRVPPLVASNVERRANSSHEGEFGLRSYFRLYPFSSFRGCRVGNREALGSLLDGEGLALFCRLSSSGGVISVVRYISFPGNLEANAEGLFECIRRCSAAMLVPLDWGEGEWAFLSASGDRVFLNGDEELDSLERFESVLLGLTEKRGYVLASVPQGWLRDGAVVPVCNRQAIRLYLGGSSEGGLRLLDSCLISNYGARGDSFDPSLHLDSELELHEQVDIRSGLACANSRSFQGKFLRERGDAYLPGDFLPGFSSLSESVCKIMSKAGGDLRFVSVDVALPCTGVPEVLRISKNPSFPSDFSWSEEARAHLRSTLAFEQSDFSFSRDVVPDLPLVSCCRRTFVKGRRFIQRNIRRLRELFLRSQGFSSREANLWVARVSREIRRSPLSGRKKIRALAKKGFIPSHAAYLEKRSCVSRWRMSEKEYASLHPLNGKYGIWVNDRVSALRVFAPYKRFFENTYAQIFVRDDELLVIGSSLYPKDKSQDFIGLMKLLSEKRELEIVSSAWRRDLRVTLVLKAERVYLNGRPLSYDQLYGRLVRLAKRISLVVIEPVRGSDEFDGAFGGEKAVLDVLLRKEPKGRAIVCDARVCLSVDKEFSPTRADVLDMPLASPSDSAVASRSVSEYLDEPVLSRFERCTSSVDLENGSFEIPDKRSFSQHCDELPTQDPGRVAFVPNWDVLKQTLEELCNYAPHLNFIEFHVRPTQDAFKVVRIDSRPSYWLSNPYSRQTQEYLLGLCEEKRDACSSFAYRFSRFFDGVKRALRKRFTLALYPKGLVYYQGTKWLLDVARDSFAPNGISLKTKHWAHKNGFLSWRIPQYGITSENRNEFISDFEYRWLRHINGKYRYWLEDKVTIKYVLADYSDLLPEYYYFTKKVGGRNVVMRMMDCPAGFSEDLSGVLSLAREKGVLAMKPDEGSHGEGFCRLEYIDGAYYLNGVQSEESAVRALLEDARNQYVITEFIVQHPDMARLYPDSVNTLRLTVFKRDGLHAEVGNAYLRVGSSKTGGVDNIGAGGMMAEVDVSTGYFGNARIMRDGGVFSQAVHPDTGVLIEGVIPNWEFAKRKVIEMANELSQLEYFGFDVAITETGIKLPEVNRFPDFPRIDRLTPETMSYLLERLEWKKKIYGYNEELPKSLLGFLG